MGGRDSFMQLLKGTSNTAGDVNRTGNLAWHSLSNQHIYNTPVLVHVSSENQHNTGKAEPKRAEVAAKQQVCIVTGGNLAQISLSDC